MLGGLVAPAVFGAVAVVLILRAVRVVADTQRLVVYRLGRPLGVRGPGLVLLLPLLDQAVAVDMCSQSLDWTLDGVELKGGTPITMKITVHYRLSEPLRAVSEVADYRMAVRELGGTALRRACRELELADLVEGRQRVEEALRQGLHATAGWGIEIERVELPQLDRLGREARLRNPPSSPRRE